MTDRSKIQGPKLCDLMEFLVQRKTILSVKLLGTDYERLTYIIDSNLDTAEKYLIIDLPEGFGNAVNKVVSWKLGFNFNGPDNLEYIFDVYGGEFHPQGLRIPCPEFVERLQRRKNFRIMTPIGTRMVITTQHLKGLMELINVSLGGAYGVITKHNLKSARGAILQMGQRIDRAGIIFPATMEMEEQVIVIKESIVRRIDHDREKRIYKYAFEFLIVEPDQSRKLTQAIYHIQRQFLSRR